MIESFKVNGTNISLASLGAECKGKNLGLTGYEPVTYKVPHALTDTFIRTNTTRKVLTLDFIVKDNDFTVSEQTPQNIEESVFILSHFHHCEIVLKNRNFIYDCHLQSAASMFLNPHKALLTLTYACEIYSPERIITLGANPQTIQILGAQATWINLEVKALQNLTNFTVTSTSLQMKGINTIIIKSLALNATEIINSYDRIANMANVDMLTFPIALGALTVATDITKATVKVKYKARW